MIIDLILDRKSAEELNPGLTLKDYTEFKNSEEGKQFFEELKHRGECVPEPYCAAKFYDAVRGYDEIFGTHISYVMDYFGEEMVQQALCEYIINNEYNPEICNYIKSVNLLIDGYLERGVKK